MSPRDRRAGGRRSDRTRPSDPDLADLAEELSSTLRELRRELGPDRGPLGLPRPPSPREVLRFTESYAIPTTIAVLEANIRALELLAAVIRAIEGSASEADRAQDRAESVSRATLDRLDDALADLQSAIEGRPTSPEARTLLDDARDLRAEIEDRLRSTPGGTGAGPAPGVDGDDTGDARDAGSGQDTHEVPVDVEGELDSIRSDIDDGEEGGSGNGGSDR